MMAQFRRIRAGALHWKRLRCWEGQSSRANPAEQHCHASIILRRSMEQADRDPQPECPASSPDGGAAREQGEQLFTVQQTEWRRKGSDTNSPERCFPSSFYASGARQRTENLLAPLLGGGFP